MTRSYTLLIALLLCSQVFSQQPYSLDVRADNNVSTRLYCGLQDTSGATARPDIQYIGDINGDGIQDFAIGTRNFNDNNGMVTILYGGNSNALYTGFDYCKFTDPSLGFRINGYNGEGFGYKVVPMGDLNGDGTPDIAVTAPKYSTNDGRIYVIYLPTSRPSVEYWIKDLNFYSVTAAYGTANSLGSTLSPAGDQNGDGAQDIIIGSSGSNVAYILFGQKTATKGSDVTITQINASQGIILSGSQGDTNFGAAVSMCGDINGDGKPELLITSPATKFVYIWYGTSVSPSPISQTIQSNMNGYLVYAGSAGLSTVSAPVCVDINNDGALDLAVASNTGLVYVIYGGSIFGITDMGNMQAFQGFYIRRYTSSTSFGSVLATSTNHSGIAKNDLIIGDYLNNAAYMLYADRETYGPHSGLSWLYIDFITPPQGYKIESKLPADSVGNAIHAEGDMNGDGIADILMSSVSNHDLYIVRGFCANGQRCIPRKLSGGQIAGIVIGVVAFAVIIAVVVIIYLKKAGKCCFGRSKVKSAPGSSARSEHVPLGQSSNTPTIVHGN